MELIINIPKSLKNAIDNHENYNLIDLAIVTCCIRNGTPIPKGHGRLIDAKEYENSIRKHYFDNSTVIRCTEMALHNVKTIIEADTESEKQTDAT